MELDKIGIERHTSKQFDVELEDIRERVLTMGGLVEQQIAGGVKALVDGDGGLGEEVARSDYKINAMEVAIDEECTKILARRQPQAGDLRLILAIAKTITDLERIGDEAEKIGRMATQLAGQERPTSAFRPIEALGRHVREMVRDALDAFARMDTEAALAVAQHDTEVDREYEGVMRQCITFMMEDPRTIRHMLDVMWAIKALERIGDHSTNIGEYVVYFVGGRDVRHVGMEELEKEVSRGQRGERAGG
ncbi:phosphate signaling complex protein PhoU [Salinisphaera sp.]|uniref:phosphate signaling complex protein PhoU n=1 Tax=Salinisphaera sp. TaxID=1914330 RepID=UPI002D7704BA|nr:phosphate signaling complex protein PhoU [Salinisphaera sp.]HET7312858.1 phosphate signaling complex protein PhoU [Salinisphaera sp.]